jgi:hypothetical protein
VADFRRSGAKARRTRRMLYGSERAGSFEMIGGVLDLVEIGGMVI